MPTKMTRAMLGHTPDPYDPCVAFDDVFPTRGTITEDYDFPIYPGTEEINGYDDHAGWLREILGRIRARRLAPSPVALIGVGYDPTPWTFKEAGVRYHIIGEDDRTGLPIFDGLRERFSAALPQPKLVRVDDQESYEAFQGGRMQARLDDLDQRLSALESTVADHISDHHAHGRLARLEQAFYEHIHNPSAHSEAVVGAVYEAKEASRPIDLPLKEVREGKIRCWQDGDELCCTIKFSGPGGKVMAATTAEPIEREVEEVVGCGIRAGTPPWVLRDVAPAAAQISGATRLIGELCGMASALTRLPAGSVVRAEPLSDPTRAALMALLQRGQRGDRRAITEATRIAWSNPAAVMSAAQALTSAQKTKARAS